jgi:hypothetical protein
VKNGQSKVIEQLAPGDLVFIYESESGALPLRLNPDGICKARGRAGIVALVRVVERAMQPADSAPEEYDNGQTLWWRFRAPTTSINSGGFISRAEFLPLIGYKANWNLHGFGDHHSGVKRLKLVEFEALRKKFEESADRENQKRLEYSSRPGKFGGPGGEGDTHRKLKDRIAANPARVLDEDGLSLYKKEFSFKDTGDRIDVLLQDNDKRYVAVEVEVECDSNLWQGHCNV